MRFLRRHCVFSANLCLLGLLAFAGVERATADPPDAAAEKTAEPTAEKAADADKDDALRERTIYVPYDKLRQTFEKEGRGVFIPYDRFQELWKAARAHQERTEKLKPPVPAVITSVDSQATVEKEVVRVVARLQIEVLATGWVEVPLHLQDAGIVSARLMAADGGEEPARLIIAAEGQRAELGYRLMVENKTHGPQAIELRLEYAKAFNKSPGRNDVAFAAPQAAVNRWKVVVPEADVKIHIDPMIAASEPPAAADEPAAAAGDAKPAAAGDAQKDPRPAGESVLLAFVGAAPQVRIDWTAKAEGASGLAALASVEAQQQVRVEEAALRTQVRLIYTISRAELSHLTIEVPADQKVINVSEANVRQWSVEKAGDKQKITVQLFEPAAKSEAVDVLLEQYSPQPAEGKAAGGKSADAKLGDAKPADAKPADAKAADGDAPAAKEDEPARRNLSVPVVRALDVSRQQGIVVVDVADGLQIEARDHGGLAQLDSAELPAALAKRKYELAYRYAAVPFALDLDVTKIKPRVLADELVIARINPDEIDLQLRAVYTIERAGLFELALEVPSGYDVREVRGEAIGAATPVQIDSFHLQGDDKSRLVVNLARQALGCVGLFVELHKRLDDANLLGPTGKSSALELSLPRVVPQTVERTLGRLVISAPESLRVNPGKQAGLRSVSLAETLAGSASAGDVTTERRSCRGVVRLCQAAGRVVAVGRAPQAVCHRGAITGGAGRPGSGQIRGHVLRQHSL